MSLRKKSESAGLKVWTVAELGAFYSEHRSDLIAHASRILKDKARAEEVIQEALIRVMLAAPELESTAHALGYIHRTIENLCIDIFRIEGRRPNLIVLDDATTEIESKWVESKDHADVMAVAEDAAIVRQALAMLSPAERAALVMWEMEGRSTKEIAAELGIKESAVRHTLARARASLRRVMSELIIDKERGLTALDMLSTTYKKVAQVAKKSSKAALSLIIVFFAFLGFNSAPTLKIIDTQSLVEPLSSAKVVEQSTGPINTTPSPKASEVSGTQTANKQSENVFPESLVKSSELNFPGLDSLGIPEGFSVSDSSGALGTAYFRERSATITETELVASQIIKTDSGAANVFFSQYLTTDDRGLTYEPVISYGAGGQWIPLKIKLGTTELKRLLDGSYLYTAYIGVESVIESSIKVVATAKGRDLESAPRQIITRLVLDASKTKVLKQAIYVVEKGVRF